MTTGTKFMCAWVVSALSVLLVCSQEFTELKAIYDRVSADIAQVYSKDIESEQNRYVNTLETLKTWAIERKDLQTSSAAIAEIDRFNKTKTLPTEPAPGQVPQISVAQSHYVQKSLKHEMTYAEQLGDLTAKYWVALTKLRNGMDKTKGNDEVKNISLACDNAVAMLKRFTDQIAAIKERQTTETLRAEAQKPPTASTSSPATSTPPDNDTKTAGGGENTEKRLIDINSAPKENLALLPGIGEKLAERIIAARPFRDKKDLMKVSGIGDKKFNDLKDYIQATPHAGEPRDFNLAQ